jgi:hypothetical protein
MRPVKTIAKMEEERIKRMMEGGIQLWYIWYVVSSFANATMYTQHNDKNK